MADRWTLRTPTGDVQLNASFHAPKYQPGGVDRGAALRRDGRSAYQRSGDGLATPGPLRLRGRVWSDEQSIPAMLAELDVIRDAVGTCIQVVRVTSYAMYTYDQIAGGPPPHIAPDGLGGWEVEIELWPGRPTPTVVPIPKGGEYIGGHSATSTSTDEISVTIPAETMLGDRLYLMAVSRASPAPTIDWIDPNGWTRKGGSQVMPTVTLGAAWERTAQAGDAGNIVTVTAEASLARALAIVVAVRGYTFTGQWLYGNQHVLNIPVDLLPGDLFAAFAFSNGNELTGPADIDGGFPQVLHPSIGLNPRMHGAFIAGTAPAPITQVRIAHDNGINFNDVAVFV